MFLVLHLQTLGVWLQGRDNVTRPSLWASQGLWRSPSHQCSDLPSTERQAVPPGRRGAVKLKSRALFPPHPPLRREYRRLSCLSSTYFSFLPFYISHPFRAASLPRRPCSIVEEVLGGPSEVLGGHPGSAPNSSCAIGLVPPHLGASVSPLAK